MVVLAASNRIGVEENESATMTFYGSSFIAGPTGEKAAEANRTDQSVITASFDLERKPGEARRMGPVPRPPPGTLRPAADARRRGVLGPI